MNEPTEEETSAMKLAKFKEQNRIANEKESMGIFSKANPKEVKKIISVLVISIGLAAAGIISASNIPDTVTSTGVIILFSSVIILVLRTAFVSKEESEEAYLSYSYGASNASIQCPHCKTKGSVRTKGIKNKKGISGGKATAALLTGGVSMLATGLSRKEKETQMHCTNCDMTWVA